MKTTWITAGVLAGAGLLAMPADSQAGARVGIGIFIGHDDYGNGSGYGYARGAYRVGYERGYRDGLHHGASDGRDGDSYNLWHDRHYRHGDAGYRGCYGPRYEYVAGYRRGYEQGYRSGYVSTRGERCYRPGYDRDRYDRDRDYRDRDRDDEDDDDGGRIIHERPRPY